MGRDGHDQISTSGITPRVEEGPLHIDTAGVVVGYFWLLLLSTSREQRKHGKAPRLRTVQPRHAFPTHPRVHDQRRPASRAQPQPRPICNPHPFLRPSLSSALSLSHVVALQKLRWFKTQIQQPKSRPADRSQPIAASGYAKRELLALPTVEHKFILHIAAASPANEPESTPRSPAVIHLRESGPAGRSRIRWQTSFPDASPDKHGHCPNRVPSPADIRRSARRSSKLSSEPGRIWWLRSQRCAGRLQSPRSGRG